MDTRRTVLRGVAALSLAIAVVGSAVLVPSASAAPLPGTTELHSVANKTKKDKESASTDNEGDSGGGLSDLPVIGDVVNQVQNESPDQLVDDVAGLAHFIVPLLGGIGK
jgi:hypothetical protein